MSERPEPGESKSAENTKFPDIYNKDSLTDKMDILCNFILTSKHYSDILYSLNAKPIVTIRVNPADDQRLVEIFNNEPEEFVHSFKAALVSLASTSKVKDNIRMHTKIEISDATQIKLHQWGADLEGVPVAVNCQVIGVNKQETYTKFAQAYCSECGQSEQLLSLGKLPRCPDKDCEGHKKVMTFDKSTLKTGDIRTVLIQELIEDSKNGTPVNFDCLLKDNYALMTHIGQRIRLIGTFRSYPQEKKVTNQILINTISLYPLDQVEEAQPTDPQIEYFKTLSKKENYLDIIAESIAPEILHERLAKLCVLLSLIGAPEVDRMIGMIHTLLIGNPAQGKSKILEYLLLLIKNSAMAVGGTMSGSGVTVTMDTLPNRQRMPRAGIIPLCNGGLAIIDEINQILEEDQGKMHQCMASGWISYNKGGFDLTLKAMTTIVAGANPRYYIYKTNHSIVDNIGLTAPLISRFDLICNMSKKKSEMEKRQIYQHMDLVDRIGVSEYIKKQGLLTVDDLAAFVSYCKTFNPVSTPEADKVATDFQMRIEAIEQPDGSLPIDNRFYHAVKKISKAFARLYFSDKVLPEHVNMAIDIMKRTLLTFDMNVELGQAHLKTHSDTKSWHDSFIAVALFLQQKNPDGRFTETECCNTCMVQYPEYFKTYQKAEKCFTDMQEKMTKIDGRYKLS